MSNIYAIWQEVGAYEGEDKLLGIYSSFALAKAFRTNYLDNTSTTDRLYITVIAVDENAVYDFNGALGDMVDINT